MQVQKFASLQSCGKMRKKKCILHFIVIEENKNELWVYVAIKKADMKGIQMMQTFKHKVYFIYLKGY